MCWNTGVVAWCTLGPSLLGPTRPKSSHRLASRIAATRRNESRVTVRRRVSLSLFRRVHAVLRLSLYLLSTREVASGRGTEKEQRRPRWRWWRRQRRCSTRAGGSYAAYPMCVRTRERERNRRGRREMEVSKTKSAGVCRVAEERTWIWVIGADANAVRRNSVSSVYFRGEVGWGTGDGEARVKEEEGRSRRWGGRKPKEKRPPSRGSKIRLFRWRVGQDCLRLVELWFYVVFRTHSLSVSLCHF